MADNEYTVYRVEYNDQEICSALKSVCLRKDPSRQLWNDLCYACPILTKPGCDLGTDENGEEFQVYFTQTGFEEFVKQVLPRLERYLNDADGIILRKVCLINPKIAHKTTHFISCWPTPELILRSIKN